MGETLSFAPRKVIKSQVLSDFVAEWTDTQLPPAQIQSECWTMYFDGSLMKTGAGAGLLLVSPLGIHMRYMIRLHFAASNNVTEYEALVNGLQTAIELGVRRLDMRGDSQLVVDQVMKESSCHDPKMKAYCAMSVSHGGQPCSIFKAFAMAHKGKATSDVDYNLEDRAEAYSNATVHNRLTSG
ncbi:uncharacterized protein [Miscanthus floridulus]|uniref:uncharacterized protein n=1 Tax=Miscanthus floridulus TaxID=154761 RepID=UPI00345B0D5E